MSEQDFEELNNRIVEISHLEKALKVNKQRVSNLLRKSNLTHSLNTLYLLRLDKNPDIEGVIDKMGKQLKNLQ